MRKSRKGQHKRLSPENYQAIAEAIVQQPTRPLKSFCNDFNVSYAVIYTALKEYVNVSKSLTLRYPAREASTEGILRKATHLVPIK